MKKESQLPSDDEFGFSAIPEEARPQHSLRKDAQSYTIFQDNGAKVCVRFCRMMRPFSQLRVQGHLSKSIDSASIFVLL